MNYNLSTADYISLVLKVVKQYPYNNSDHYEQPNTFTVNAKIKDAVTEQNAGKLLSDFKKGEFWSRDWVGGGAKEESMQRGFPLVNLNTLEVQLDKNYTSGTKRFLLEVLDIEYCDNCSDKRTDDERMRATNTIAINIIEEMRRHIFYGKPNSPILLLTEQESLSPAYSGYEPIKYVDTLLNRGETMRDYKDESLGIVGTTIEFFAQVCYPKRNFNYNFLESEKVAPTVKCQMCG